MVSHRSLRSCKSRQVFRTLLNILTDLNNAVVSGPLISKSSLPCTNPFLTVPRTPITIGITVTFLFHSFFSSLASSRYLSFFFRSLLILLCGLPGQKSPKTRQVLFFFCWQSGRLAEIRWSVCISKSQRTLCVSFTRTNSGLCIYHLFV